MIVAFAHMTWLYFRHLFTLKQLEVKGVGVSREIIAGRTRTRIQWHADGCHRISIEGYRELVGSVSGISIMEVAQPQVLNIRFHGCYSIRNLTIEVPATDIQFFKQFNIRENLGDKLPRHKIKHTVFSLHPEIPAIQSNISLQPVEIHLKPQSMAPNFNQ